MIATERFLRRTAMKIVANGISMNYMVDGPADAPVVTMTIRWRPTSACGIDAAGAHEELARLR
jgi:hypothetical protein